jgi:hypothetical protein
MLYHYMANRFLFPTRQHPERDIQLFSAPLYRAPILHQPRQVQLTSNCLVLCQVGTDSRLREGMMKKAMLICLGLMFGMVSSSHTTPIYDSSANNGKETPVISSASALFENMRHASEGNIGYIKESDAMRRSSARFNRLDWFDGGLHDFFSSIAMHPGQDPVKNQGPAPEPGTILLLGSGLI